MTHQPRRRAVKSRPSPSILERIHPNAAGIDGGATEHFVAVPPDRDATPVRVFPTFTADLYQLADWLKACGITTVAMEATGVYWIPVYEILDARSVEVLLVNARHVKNVAGRQSDVLDCEWLRDLHSVGLRRGSFRPADGIVTLRAYLRHRDILIQTAAMHTQRMQKALVQMNLHLHVVISDITGLTGLRILRDLVAGQRDPSRLAQHRDRRCHASEAEIANALTGNYRHEHLFVLQQNLEAFEVGQRQLAACDAAIEHSLQTLTAGRPAPATVLPPPRSTRKPHLNEPRVEIRRPLHQLTATDLSQIDGIGPYNAWRLIAEIGTDMTRWPTAQHFTSWLTLAPRHKVSGGRLLSSRTPASANRAAALLRVAAMTLSRTNTALGAFCRRLAYRVGKAKAITATARKLAILVYRTLKGEIQYRDPGADAYDAHHRTRRLRTLTHHAAKLGYALLNIETGEVVPSPVS